MSLIQTFPDGGGGGVPNGSIITPTDDVSIWLACAGLHQSYTTLNEVLADSAVLSALMASTNAVDYLVRSTTWATDICANELAMAYIGANNYCADTLLANSTWRTAICNSTYFESVLNVKVPTMTSNTTPSGEVSASSNYANSYPAYNSFSGKDTLITGTSGWIQYKFSKSVTIYKVLIKERGNPNSVAVNSFPNSVTFKVSNDNGSTFTEVASDTYTVVQGATYTTIINNPKDGTIFRMQINSNNGINNYTQCGMPLQFYGRSDYPIGNDDAVDTNANISAIAPNEPNATSSRDYVVGEHFYKNGKFCTCTQAIAQGATFTLGTNYVEGTVADNCGSLIAEISGTNKTCYQMMVELKAIWSTLPDDIKTRTYITGYGGSTFHHNTKDKFIRTNVTTTTGYPVDIMCIDLNELKYFGIRIQGGSANTYDDYTNWTIWSEGIKLMKM